MRCISHHYPYHPVFPHSFLVSTFILILCREIQTGPLIDPNKTSAENAASPSNGFIGSPSSQAGDVDQQLKRPFQARGPAAQVEFEQVKSAKSDDVPPATNNPVTSIHETRPDVSISQSVTASAEAGTIVGHAESTAVTDDADVVTYYRSPSDVRTDSPVALRNKETVTLPTTTAQLSLHNEDTNTNSNKSYLHISSNISVSQDSLGLTFRESPTSSPIVIVAPSLGTNRSKEFVLGNPIDKNTTIKTVLRTGVSSSVSVVQPSDVTFSQNVTNSTSPSQEALKDFVTNEETPPHHGKENNSDTHQNSTDFPLVPTTHRSVVVLAIPPAVNQEDTFVSPTPTLATSKSTSHEIFRHNASVSHRPSLGTSTHSALFAVDTAQKLNNLGVNNPSSNSTKNVTTSSLKPLPIRTTQQPNNSTTAVYQATAEPNSTTVTPLSSTSSAGHSNATTEVTMPETPVISSVHASELEQSAATDHVQTSQETWTLPTTLSPTKELIGTIETPTVTLISSDPTVLNIHHVEDPLGVGAIVGIILGVLGLVILVGGVCGFLIYHRRLRPLSEVKYPTDNCGYVDDSLRVSYVNNHIELPKESSEEMFSLDNDSFLNSLEAMTLQNYWAEDAKNTKV